MADDSTTTPKKRGIGKAPYAPQNIEQHQIEHNYLLAIAIDGYEDDEISNLNNCVNDVEGNAQRDGLIRLLSKYYFFDKENIHFLRSRSTYNGKDRKQFSKQELASIAFREKNQKGYGFVGEAFHRTIIERLKYFAKNITPKDNLIICFSGHGIYDQDFDEGYWIPTDALLKDNSSYIENGTIRTALNAIKSHHTVLFSDSCYSGTLFSTGQTRSLEVPRVYQHPSRWGMTAGRKEPVSDGALGENSPFARLLLDILEDRREIWVSDLFKEISEGIEKNQEKQEPVGEALSFIKGHKNGQFVFMPRLATEEDYWRIAWETNTRKGYFAFLARYPEGKLRDAALAAYGAFGQSKKPPFSEEALQTFDFLSKRLPEEAKVFLINYLKGVTQTTLSVATRNMYREWLTFFPEQGIYPLKSFILLGKHIEQHQSYEKAYQELENESAADRKVFFKSLVGPLSNPYKGLQAYHTIDSRVFFGRAMVVKELVDMLEDNPFLLLSGPPSSGKTSVVKAGLYPVLREQEDYECVSIHLDDAPLLQLQKLLEELKQRQRLLLFIDGYERIVLEDVAQEERRQFEALLNKLCQQGKDKQFKLVLALNTNFEFEMKATDFGGYFWDQEAPAFQLYRLTEISTSDMREMILGPMWSNFLDFESDEEVDFILEEVQKMPNALTTLSFTLDQLFSLASREKFRDHGRKFTRQDAGEISQVLNNYFSSTYEHLFDGKDQDLAEKLFMRMVNLSAGSYSLRRLYLEELIYVSETENEIIHGILDKLKKAEFIRSGQDNKGEYIILVHEALITSWDRIRDWLAGFGQENLVLQRALWSAANADETAMGFQGRASVYSSYWDNDPRLAKVLDIVLSQGTGLLLAAETNKMKEEVGLIESGLSGQALRQFQTLLTKWKANQRSEYLDDFIITGVSHPLLAAFLEHGPHWLNRREVDFILKSWQKRCDAISQIIRQRDQAVEAKEKAEAAQERTISEVIEASWKAGGFYGTSIESKDTYIDGVRNIYAKLKWFMSLEKAHSISPIPIFIKAPHKRDFDFNATTFAYYNPAFLAWVRKYAIPAKGNSLLRKATQGFYDKFLRDLARVYYCAYQHLEKHPNLRDQVKEAYLKFVEGGEIQAGGSFVANSGGLMLQGRLRGYADQNQAILEQHLGGAAFYHWVVGSGFWIRREIDTTAAAFMGLLTDLLETYDEAWLARPPQLP